jgi:hypothetical protein
MTKQLTLDRYVARSMETVQGFLTPLDSQIISALLRYLSDDNIAGNLCEIGAHHGRLFFLLALARRANERALAIDLFEDDGENAKTQHAGRDRALFENARRLGIELSEQETLKASSLDIGPTDVFSRTAGPIRFFSIDGGHSYGHVENDLQLAQKTLAAQGIIAVDDFFNMGWADISFATYDFLRRGTDIVPFAITSKKIYLAPKTAVDKYKDYLRNRRDIAHILRVEVLGSEVLAFRQSMLKKGYELLRGALARRAS